jgi:hypothetical protein
VCTVAMMWPFIIIIIIIIIYFNWIWVFTWWQWYYNKTQHTSHKITHHTQTKHSTQNYTNNKGHYTQWIQCKYNYNYNYINMCLSNINNFKRGLSCIPVNSIGYDDMNWIISTEVYVRGSSHLMCLWEAWIWTLDWNKS